MVIADIPEVVFTRFLSFHLFVPYLLVLSHSVIPFIGIVLPGLLILLSFVAVIKFMLLIWLLTIVVSLVVLS